MRIAVVIATFVSALIFPWYLTAILALCGAFFEPLLPLGVGLFLDALYYPHAAGVASGTALGSFVTVLAYLVRAQVRERLA